MLKNLNGEMELSVFCAGIIQNETMIEYAAQNRHETELYSKFNQYYGVMIAYCGRDCGKCEAYLATINDD